MADTPRATSPAVDHAAHELWNAVLDENLPQNDEDWTELGNRVFDQEVLFWTMRECRREFYPALYTDQYYYPENNLDGHRMLLHFVEKMTIAFQEKVRRGYEEDNP